MGYKLKQKSFSEIKSFAKEPSWDEELNPVTVSKCCENKNVKIRICAPMTPIGMHFVCTKPSDMALPFNQRVGKVFPVWCPDFDPDSETFIHDKCECCNDTFSQKQYIGKGKIFYYTQGFIESKDKKGRTTWGDMQVLVFDSMAIQAIRNVYETTGNCIDPYNKKEGYSLWVKYDTSTKPTKYYISKDRDIPLKEIEGYSKDDLVDFSEYFKPTDPAKIKESLERCGYYEFIKNENAESENDFDEEEPKKKKKKVADDDEDDEDEDEKSKKKKARDENDYDDDDDEPKKKKKSKDEDEDDDEDDDDEEEERVAKKKKKSKDEDEDDDDDDSDSDDEDDDDSDSDDDDDDDDSDSDDDDDDDDEDEKPKKKKKSKDDDEDDDDEDDDDEPKKKKKKKSKDDDDDDEDEKPKKKKKKYDWDD